METQKHKQETKLLEKYYKLIKKKETKLDMFKTHLPTYKTNLQVNQKKYTQNYCPMGKIQYEPNLTLKLSNHAKRHPR